MILNAYAVLDWFVVLLRCLVALIVIALGSSALRNRRLGAIGPRDANLEDRSYLLFSLSLLLAALTVVSWPLLYLYLQSMVPQWTGAMCVYGVKQIGAGSDGISRFLPALVNLLENFKPLQVFLSGVWLVMYRINRKTQTAPFSRRIIQVQVVLGVVALIDGFSEVAYLAIPKRDNGRSVGCCTVAYAQPQSSVRSVIERLAEPDARYPLVAAYLGLNAGLLFSLWAARRRNPVLLRVSTILLATVVVPVTALFMIAVAAPTVLHLPHHHCLYDLIPKAPDMLFGIGLFVWGIFSLGWAGTARLLGGIAETKSLVESEQRWLLGMASYCLAGSLIVTSLGMVLA